MEYPKIKKSENNSSRKTKKAIRNALVSIMQEKELSTITVKELTEKADICRKTFYIHYGQLNEVLDEIQLEFLEEAQLMLEGLFNNGTIINVYDILASIHDLVVKKDSWYYDLFESAYGPKLIIELTNILAEGLYYRIRPIPIISEQQLRFTCKFIASGLIGMYYDWEVSEDRIELEELALIMTDLISNGMPDKIEKYVPEFTARAEIQ